MDVDAKGERDRNKMPGVKKTYTVLTFADGKAQPGGSVFYSKGYRIGDVTAQDLVLDDRTLKGTFTGTVSGKTVNFTLDCRVLGNRWVAGPCKAEADGNVTEMILRGGLCEADTCQIEGCSADQKKQVKEMQAAMEPAKAPEKKPAKKKEEDPVADLL